VINLQANAKEIVMEITNKHIVKCENCVLMYRCPRTYLGGCTDGIEWDIPKKEEKDED
jgi:hypothetical protein